MTRLGPLAERNFRLLFAARAISFAGDSFAVVAVAFAVLELTGSPTDLGLTLVAYTGPRVVLMLAGGVWADRLPRRLLMVATSTVSACVQALTAALLLAHAISFWQLVVLQAAAGAARAVYGPAARSIVPQTVPEPWLRQANALLRISVNATQVGGAALAGLVVGAAGPGWAFVVDAASFAVAAALFAAMRVPRLVRELETPFLADLAAGWREFRALQWLWVSVVSWLAVNLADFGALDVLGPVTAKRHLGGASAWGAILAAEAGGFFVGGALALRVGARRPLLVGQLLTPALAVPMVLLAPPLATAAVAAAAFAAGAVSQLYGVWWETILQREIPTASLGRVLAWEYAGSLVSVPLGMAAAGPAAAAVGRATTLYGAAALVVVASLAPLLSGEVRTLAQ